MKIKHRGRGRPKKEPERYSLWNDISFWRVVVLILSLGVLILTYIGSTVEYRYNAVQEESYCIPKGYSGVYYDLTGDNVAITVLDLNDATQGEIAAQLSAVFKQMTINKAQGGE